MQEWRVRGWPKGIEGGVEGGIRETQFRFSQSLHDNMRSWKNRRWKGKRANKRHKLREKKKIKTFILNKQCWGSEMFTPDLDPNFFYPGSRIQGQKDPGSGSASKNLGIFNPKKLFLSSRKYNPGLLYRTRIRILIFLPIPDTGSRGTDPQHGDM